MEEHTVDSGAEHQVQVGLHLRERRAEVFGQPRESFA